MANGTIGVSQIDVLTTSGTGTVSIVPPATNTNRTLTLPDTSATLVAVNPGASGNILTSNGTSWTSASASAPIFSYREITSGTTYTPSIGIIAFWVFVWGATGGRSSAAYRGGVGGAGYSEKYYSTVASSYSYSIGAGGTTSGTAGGTTTFDVISITGSGGVTSATGSSGGVGSGGDFNATGGTGGNGVTSSGGGGGGIGSRAGNGGNGGNGTSGVTGGGGGGTGGNNASGATAGAAATSKAAGALVLPFGFTSEIFTGGENGNGVCACTGGNYSGGNGSFQRVTYNGAYWGTCVTSQQTIASSNAPANFYIPSQSRTGGRGGSGSISAATSGSDGLIIIVERIR